MSQKVSQQLTPVKEDIIIYGARVSTKGSSAETIVNLSRKEPYSDIIPTMGLYVDDDYSTCLVALGKVYEEVSTIHHVYLTNDVVKVVVEEVRDADAQVPFPALEVHCEGEALNSFIAWSRHLVKPVSHEILSLSYIYMY